MLVVCGFNELELFDIAAKRAIALCPNLRRLAFAIVFITFFSSMLITNDVALITFVPLSLVLLSSFEIKTIIYIVVMQTVAANIGSSLTPVGNPQNLYIFSFYRLAPASFFAVTVPFVLFGGLLIFLSLLFLPKLEVDTSQCKSTSKLNIKKLSLYILWFILSVAAVFNWTSYIAVFAVISATALAANPKLFKSVDYSLLITFSAFFIFVENISSIESIRLFLNGMLARNTMLISALTSQFISNVPAAVLLSGFTQNSTQLLLGVNVGGCGTLIASLASVISYKLFSQKHIKYVGLYIIVFSAVNAIFLVVLSTFAYFYPLKL